jgi:hypothetical protein
MKSNALTLLKFIVISTEILNEKFPRLRDFGRKGRKKLVDLRGFEPLPPFLQAHSTTSAPIRRKRVRPFIHTVIRLFCDSAIDACRYVDIRATKSGYVTKHITTWEGLNPCQTHSSCLGKVSQRASKRDCGASCARHGESMINQFMTHFHTRHIRTVHLPGGPSLRREGEPSVPI